MKYCSKCGNILKESDVFCARCGAKTSVFGVTDKPAEKKTSTKAKAKTKPAEYEAPGARYTAAVEKNAIAVTEYLKRASEMEWEKYEIDQILKGLSTKMEATDREIEKEEQAIANYNDKIAQIERKIKDYKKQDYRRKVFNFKFKFDLKLFAIIFGALLAVFAIGGLASFPPFSWVFNGIVSAGSPGGHFNLFIVLVLLFGIPALAVAAVQLVKYYRDKAEHERSEDEATIMYEEEQARLERDALESYNNDLSDYENIVKERENEKARLVNVVLKGLENERDAGRAERRDLEDTLERYYSNQVLYPRYRDVVPVTTMLDYFQSGRCSELSGHGGAFNSYEKDLKSNAIMAQLADIMAKPESVAESQKPILKKAESIKKQVAGLLDTVNAAAGRNMANNPVGDKLSAPLETSKELRKLYEGFRAKKAEHMEYVDSVDHY